ncbi:hypothetical protein O9992_05330 [Vibrio lentus]|nr:hypothetical protein [Vibrio lentus]
MFLFINTKGGMGEATTLALNTAVEIASYHLNESKPLDIDLQFGVIPEYLNITPTYASISDAIDSSNDLDEMSLSSLVNKAHIRVTRFKFQL